MALLVGTEVEGTGNASGTIISTEKDETFKYTAAKSGTVEVIKFRTGSGVQAATSVVGAVRSDVAGKPGVVISEATLVVTTASSTTYEITGLSAAVTAETAYWLELIPLGGVIRVRTHKPLEAGSSPSFLSATPTKVKKASEVLTWGAEEVLGPWFIAGLGAESGGSTGNPMTMLL
jgi:hypothetical protein